LDGYGAFMQLDGFFDYGQSESGADPGFGSFEWLENRFYVFYSGAGVFNRDRYGLAVAIVNSTDGNQAAIFFHRFEGIYDKIKYYIIYLIGIADHLAEVFIEIDRKGPAMLNRFWLQRFDREFDKTVKIAFGKSKDCVFAVFKHVKDQLLHFNKIFVEHIPTLFGTGNISSFETFAYQIPARRDRLKQIFNPMRKIKGTLGCL
jgi:hypothetical protein